MEKLSGPLAQPRGVLCTPNAPLGRAKPTHHLTWSESRVPWGGTACRSEELGSAPRAAELGKGLPLGRRD